MADNCTTYGFDLGVNDWTTTTDGLEMRCPADSRQEKRVTSSAAALRVSLLWLLMTLRYASDRGT